MGRKITNKDLNETVCNATHILRDLLEDINKRQCVDSYDEKLELNRLLRDENAVLKAKLEMYEKLVASDFQDKDDTFIIHDGKRYNIVYTRVEKDLNTPAQLMVIADEITTDLKGDPNDD